MERVSNSRLNNLKVSFTGALKMNGGVLIALVILMVISTIASPKFLSFSNMMMILRTISTTALCAFGMTFVVLTGGIDLSVGSFMSLAGCLTTVLIAQTGIPSWLAITLSLFVGILFGATNGLIITKMNMPPFIVTLATMNIMRGISYTLTEGKPVSVQSDFLFEQIGSGYVGPVPIAAFYVTVAFALFWMLLNRARFGRHIYAVGGSITAARFSGIKTDRTVFFAYVISGVLSAFGGIILSSRLNSGQPTLGQGAELDAIASCIVGGASLSGGTGTLMGTLIGALIMGIISNILNLIGINSFIQLVIKGIIIILFVYINISKQKVKIKHS